VCQSRKSGKRAVHEEGKHYEKEQYMNKESKRAVHE
jgi:hypothetical protein